MKKENIFSSEEIMNEEGIVKTILFGGINMGVPEDEAEFRKMLKCAYEIGKENDEETKRYITNLIKEWFEEPMICFKNLSAEKITFKGKRLEEYTSFQLVQELEKMYKCKIDSLNTEKVKDKAEIMVLQEEVSEKEKELESTNKTVSELETENFNLRRQIIDMLERINVLQDESIDLSSLKGKLKATPYVPVPCPIKEELEKLNKEDELNCLKKKVYDLQEEVKIKDKRINDFEKDRAELEEQQKEDRKCENWFEILLIFLYMMSMPPRKNKVYFHSSSLPKEIEDLIRDGE